MEDSKLTLQQNILWNSAGSFIYLSFQWLISYLVVRILGFENAGIFSLAISISSVAFAFAIYGVRGYQVSDIKRKYSDKSYIAARLVTCVLAVLGTLIYLSLYKYALYTTLCIGAYLVFKLSEAFVDVYHGIIQRGMRLDIIGKSFILRGVISSSLFVACVILTRNLLFSTSMLAFSSFALIYFYDHKKVEHFCEKNNDASVRTVLNVLLECFPLAVYLFLSNLVMSIPRVSLGNMKGSAVLGIYASIAIPAAIVQVLAGYIFSPMLTIFADHVDKKSFHLFHKLFFRVLLYILTLSVVIIIGGAILGEFGLVLLFGEKIRSYTYLFVPILVLSGLTALSWFIGLMLTVLREFKGLIIASFVAVTVCLGGSSYFISRFGINGTSFILIFSLVLQISIMSVFMSIKLKRLAT